MFRDKDTLHKRETHLDPWLSAREQDVVDPLSLYIPYIPLYTLYNSIYTLLYYSSFHVLFHFPYIAQHASHCLSIFKPNLQHQTSLKVNFASWIFRSTHQSCQKTVRPCGNDVRAGGHVLGCLRFVVVVLEYLRQVVGQDMGTGNCRCARCRSQ